MTRSRDLDECPKCKQAPRDDEHGRLVCDCPGQFWQYKAGIAGSPEDRGLLEQHGWQLVETPYDIYWVGPYLNIMYLHEGDSWYCDTAPRRFTTLEEYLDWYSEKSADAHPHSRSVQQIP